MIVSVAKQLEGGTALTALFARHHRKPCLHLHAGSKNPGKILRRFLDENQIKVLNVAGPRASEEPGAGTLAKKVLRELFARPAQMGRQS
jgi:hypothetical protein